MCESRRVWLPVLIALCAFAACAESPPPPLPGNLLAELAPTSVSGVRRAERLTDGLAATEGDFWQTGLTAHLTSARANATWDLGSAKPIRCIAVQGDNNDHYRVSTSNDGRSFQPLWTGGPVDGAGMRFRHGTVETSARYVRVDASGGDGMYSVGELALFSTCPQGWPAIEMPRAVGVPVGDSAITKLWLFTAVAVAFVLLHRRGGRRRVYALAGVAVLLGIDAARTLLGLFPDFWEIANSPQESALRAVVAIIAAAVLVKEVFVPERFAPHPRVVKVTLGVLAFLSVACYYHFASPQFWDAAKGRRTLVHTFDMRHYFPTAKYFDELRFDGLYLASLAAYADLATDGSVGAIKDARLRDLTTYEMTTGERAYPQLAQIRARFTPERWTEFKRDMKYFLDTMGPGDYLGSMQDHGGNATPVWLLGAWALFRAAPANELTISLAGLIDPLLLAVFFVVLCRTFGARVMLYTLILFGATDFYQFGSNLMGSTLRQDWLVALGLGACALKTQRTFLGGFLLAYGGLIRAFPALAAMFLVVPVLWFVVDTWRRTRKPPSVDELRTEQRPTLRAIGGAAAAVIGLVLVSGMLFGMKDAWGTWFKKMEIHATGPSTNNVGLRNILAYKPSNAAQRVIQREHPEPWVEWQRLQIETFGARRPLFYLLNLAAAALALLACRGRPLHQVSLLGLLMVPFLFYPSNYYCHFIFLLPIAVAAAKGDTGVRDQTFGFVVLAMLVICIGQYFTLAEGWSDRRYTYQSMWLLGAFSAVLVYLGRIGWRDLRGRGQPAST